MHISIRSSTIELAHSRYGRTVADNALDVDVLQELEVRAGLRRPQVGRDRTSTLAVDKLRTWRQRTMSRT